MKTFQVILILMVSCKIGDAQIPIRDKHITHQQERMVHKQWDKNKFTPDKGFLGLNPLYWLTWGLHRDYPKKDLRPLSPAGTQTQRLALVLAMQTFTNQFKLHADTLRNTALSEAVNYSSLVSDTDPLWILYYRHEFASLLNHPRTASLDNLTSKERDYLLQNGAFGWYMEEAGILSERLQAARTTTLDRGSRMISYHRLLAEYRKLSTAWEAKKANASKFLSLTKTRNSIRNQEKSMSDVNVSLTDKQIADKILKSSKL